MFPINHYYCAYWQYRLKTSGQLEITNINHNLFPNEIAISEIITTISIATDPEYAIILTDYFGGIGVQFANVFKNRINCNKKVSTINDALKHLGVKTKNGKDEFSTLGLDKLRTQPDYLDKYEGFTNELGI